MEERDDAAIVERLADALDNALCQQQEKARMTRWLVIMEAIDESGNYGLWTVGGPDTKPWDMLGMLRYAETVQRAEVADSARGDIFEGGDEED